MAKIERTQVRRRTGTRDEGPVTPVSVPSIVGEQPGVVKSLKGVLFGPPKTAKTTLACSGKNVLLINFDPDGELTETLVGREDITVVKPQTFSEIEGIIKALHTVDRGRFDWITVDSITFLFQLLGGKELTEVYIQNKDVRRAYGKAGAMVSQIIHDLTRLPDTNVIFTAHLQKEDGIEDSVAQEAEMGEHEVRVAVTPMVWKILGPSVSFIGRTYKEGVWEKVEGSKVRNKRNRYVVSFNDGERSPAGSRLKMDGEYEIELDTLAKLHDELVEGDE